MRRKLSETKRFCRSRSSRPGSVTSLIRLQTAISTGSIDDDAGTWKTWNIKRPWDRSDLFYRGERGAFFTGGDARIPAGILSNLRPSPRKPAPPAPTPDPVSRREGPATLVTAESHGGAPRVANVPSGPSR